MTSMASWTRKGSVAVAAGILSFALLFMGDVSPGKGVQRHRLDNGLLLLLYPTESTNDVALVVLYGIGEDHDPEGKSGLAHLVEHVYITAAVADTQARTADDIMAQYPKGWNAQTGTDYTVFAAVFPADGLETELRETAARMGDLRPTVTDLAREKARLLQELDNMYRGFPPLAAVNHARTRIRPSALGHRKGGLPDQVQRMTIPDVEGHWSRYYKPGNATLVLAGALNTNHVRNLIGTHFGSIAPGHAPIRTHKMGPVNLEKIDYLSVPETLASFQGHACIAFAAPEHGSEYYAASLVLISRMWMRSASSGGKPQIMFNLLDDPTLISVSASLAAGDTGETGVQRLRSFVDEIVRTPFQSADILSTKNSVGPLLGLLDFPRVMLQDNLYGVAFSVGRRDQLGLDAAELGTTLEHLKDVDIKAAGKAIFGGDRQAAVVVVPKP